jgi:hypothetical protein
VWGECSIDEDFDPSKLTMVRYRYMINGETAVILADVDYRDLCEIGDTIQHNVSYFVILPDGEASELMF